MSAGHERSSEHGRTDAGHGDRTQHSGLRFCSPGPEPAAFAARADVVFPEPAPPASVDAAAREFLTGLADELAAAGCVLVGHIKGTLNARGGGLAFHLTSLTGTPRLGGELPGAVPQATLTINAIVFGVDPDALAPLVTSVWAAHCEAETTWLI